MPEINQIQNNISAAELAEKARSRNIKIVDKRKDALDKQSFLKLLITQLKHQDPLEPVNDREFIAQMAQFSSLEQMTNVSKSMDSLKSFQANMLLGKYITGSDLVTRKSLGGVVDQVLFDASGQVLLRVNGRRMKFSDVTSVGLAPQQTTETNLKTSKPK